jgi:hypothetical protein
LADGSDPLFAALRYGLFALLALGVPGLALQRLARVRADPALVLPLGLLHCSLAYLLSLRLAAPWVFPALTAAVGLAGAVSTRIPAWRAWSVEPHPGERGAPPLRGVLPPLLLLIALFAATQYRVNRVAGSGVFLLDVGEHQDTALHVGLTWELVAGYPPQVPGLAGVEMRYHVGSHLVRAAAARWAGIHPYDSLSRFEITLWGAGLVLVLRAAAQALGLGAAAVALAGFLPLAADLSFVPGLLLGSQFWAFKLGDNLVEATFYANSIAPALLLVLGALVALARAEAGRGTRWLAVAAVLGAGAAHFKVFTGAQLLLALGCVWLLRRDRRLLVLAAPAAVVLGLLVLASIAPGPAPGVDVRVVPFAPTNPARAAFQLPEVGGLAYVASGFAWIVLSLGLRAFGLPGAWRSMFAGSGARAVAGALALSGWLIATFVSIRADPDVDESFYFLQASGLLLWLFAAPVLASIGRRSLVLGLLLAAAVFAPTAEFVVRKAPQEPLVVPAPAVRAMAALREASCPGDVVLSRVRADLVPLPVVLAGRRVALADYIGYWRQFTTLEALEDRRARVRSFFQARQADEALSVARETGARYVHVRGREPAPVESTGVLEPLFAEGQERVYGIPALAPARDCRRGARPSP